MENILCSSASAISELIFTHPIDYYKTLKQNNIKNIYKIIYKNPYKGVSSRLVGIVPMRISFWSTLDYLKNNKYNPIIIPLITSTIQTILDVPIEQAKTNLMNRKNITFIPKYWLKGSINHYARNILFTYGFFFATTNIDNPLFAGLFGGFIGSIISHPFDSLKTFYQSGNNNPQINYKFLYRGLIPRTSVSFISMGVGFSTFSFFKTLFI